MPIEKAAWHVDDGLQGRDAHGRAYCMTQDSPRLQLSFQIQTADWFSNLVMFALVLNMCLGLYDPLEMSSVGAFTVLSLQILCLTILAADMLLKAYYMGFNDYFKKNWQFSHGIGIVLLLLDWLAVALFSSHALALARAARPGLMITRSREVRRVYTVAKDSIPKMTSSFSSLLALVCFYAALGLVLFPGDPNFEGFPRAMLSLFILSTLDNFPDIAQSPVVQSTGLGTVYFLSFLLLAVFFVTPLVFGSVVDSYTTQSKTQVLQDLRKQRSAFAKAYRLLNTEGDGLKPAVLSAVLKALGITDPVTILWMFQVLDVEDVGCVDALGFFNLGDVLSHDIHIEDHGPALTWPAWLLALASHPYRASLAQLASVLLLLSEGQGIASLFALPVVLGDFALSLALLPKSHLANSQVQVGYALLSLSSLAALVSSLFPVSWHWRLLGVPVLFFPARYSHSLVRVLHTALRLIPVLTYLCGFLLCLVYVYASMGVALFGWLLPSIEMWTNLPTAFSTLLQLLLSNWSEALEACLAQAEATPTALLVSLFFVSFFVFGVMLSLNLVTALVINYFGVAEDSKVPPTY